MKSRGILKKIRGWVSGTMAAVMILSAILPSFPSFNVFAEKEYTPGMTMLSGSEDWKFFCIDSYALLGEAGGVQGTNEWYAYVVPSTRLSHEETAILFWAALSLRAGIGDSQPCKNAVDSIRAKAPAQGLSPITTVTEEDMKRIIHLKSTRDKYPWLQDVLANEDRYMEMAGLLGAGGAASPSGKTIPAVLRDHTQADHALTLDKNTFTIEFDPSGADKDFIEKVPMTFSLDGGEPYAAAPPAGWTYQKTDTGIIFTNPSPDPPALTIRFDPKGTEYQTGGGGFRSAQDAYDTALQLWVCIECNDRHVQHSQKKLPLEAHQRMVYLPLKNVSTAYYAALSGEKTGGKFQFQVYRHEEDMTSTYNLQLCKYDRETGKPLEDAVFKLYERFDDKDQIDQEKDGPVHLYQGGEPYKSYHTDNPAVWDDFKFVSGVSTDENGHGTKTVNHGYHYDKTFCDGHPAPPFVPVPEEEVDEETGETANEDAIAAAQGENKRLAKDWLDCFAACEDHAAGTFQGVHFHWLMPEVDKGEIENTLSTGGLEGSTPDAGKRTSAAGEESYEKSGCQQDCQETYDKFIALRYSYALVESAARPGYVLHDVHADDLPIEVITTDSSENGANAEFAHEYGRDIAISDKMNYSLADETLAARERIASCQVAEPIKKADSGSLKKERTNYFQKLLRFLVPETKAEFFDDVELIDDVTGCATPGNAAASGKNSSATPSDAGTATSSDADRAQVFFSRTCTWATGSNWRTNAAPIREGRSDSRADAASSIFTGAYHTALNSAASGPEVAPGPDGNYSHCNDQDGEGDAWRIYDHRTEGEIHINKRDMDLEAGETMDYDSYGDSQGDGTLEGAVYGLFAATDVTHPDGKTGVVYKANNLVAVAATDRNGDASFMANTEAPGYFYDYAQGAVAETADGWAAVAPENLYTAARTYDDYTEDGQYDRTYPDYEAQNGNCWIGRPLLMGNYYIKELTRSEGCELSIGNRDNALTNNGQDYGMALPVGTGYASVTKNLYAEGQISAAPTGEYGNPDIDELFFHAESRGTGASGYDIVLSDLPVGARLYRLDTGKTVKEVQVGTGVYDKVYLKNEDGGPQYLVAENDYQYPKYNPDGSLMTEEVPVNIQARQFLTKEERLLDPAMIQTAMEAAEPSMTQAEVAARLAADFTVTDKDFLKGKTERALRASGKNTPRLRASGKPDYSSIDAGIYDVGVREGEPDEYGVSGVAPGDLAAQTVYGSPVVTLEIPKTDASGAPLKVGDAILSVLDYYNSNSFYSYGGVDSVEETADGYLIKIYASVYGNPADYLVMGSDPETDSVIHHRISYVPDDSTESPRYVYAAYSNNPDRDAFGTYEDYQGETFGGTYFSSATLVTDAVVAGDGSLVTRTVRQNVYYLTGETPHDAAGSKLQAFEYREQTVTSTQEAEVSEWTELPAEEKDGQMLVHISSTYTDRYGVAHNDTDLQGCRFRMLLPEKEITLTQADIDGMDGTDWSAGEKMGSASYYAKVRHAKAKAYLNYADLSVMGDSSFVKKADLVYPGQQYTYQDGGNTPGTNTRTVPIGVQERAITQKIKIRKEIETTQEESYDDDTYGCAHPENLGRDLFGRWLNRTPDWLAALQDRSKLPNFRFKAYLKSNLERLYRDESGTVVWMDRNGNEVDAADYKQKFPKEVQKFYTKVPHTAEIKKNSQDAAIANDQLYGFTGGRINETPNSGYTPVLERTDGSCRKFFQAIRTADTDRWDNPANRGRDFISWEEWDSVRSVWEGMTDGTTPDTSYKPFARILAGKYGASAESAGSAPAVHDNPETKNEANTSEDAKKNAMSSDAVRQFAIDWYLDEEVKKLVQENESGQTQAAGGVRRYPDEVYDQALREAIRKADDYLTPFFRYDLDTVYSIEWDGQPDGGKDHDAATLSADLLQASAAGGDPGQDGYYCGISRYLPYGIYVVVEQQPYNHAEGQYDFYNKHFRIDDPKEVALPAVYDPDGGWEEPENFRGDYRYRSGASPEEMAAKYRIRFQEEWAQNHPGDLRDYVIHSHNAAGDFEIYPYGLDLDKLTGAASGRDYAGFQVTQDVFDPCRDYYNDPLVAGKEAGGNPHSHYFADDGNAGDEIEMYYHYGSVSEDAGTVDGVPAMTGELTAREGNYAPMLVPWTVTEPAAADGEGRDEFEGYANRRFRNTFYSARLRIEKLDDETGENILHDQAIFALYAASRDDTEKGDGAVKFYEKPTVISGSREFLEAMGAEKIHTRAKEIPDPKEAEDVLWYGTVGEGTPVCLEQEQIILTDREGNRTGQFRAFTTKRDGPMAAEPEDGAGSVTAGQNTGYLETPQPLGAGTYVLAEIKPPAGYVRSRPAAVEVYSDKVSYYRDGNRGQRTAAAVYDKSDAQDLARIYVGNTPIRLEVSKKKTDADTVTYRVSGRVEGSITDLVGRYGPDNLELAYDASGTYLGYGWHKGMAELLAAMKEDGGQTELLYEQGVFSGLADLTRPLETAEDENRYVPGAVLTLCDALEVKKNGDSQDYGYDGVTVERDRNGTVLRMYVKQGYAGSKIEFVQETGGTAWTFHRVRRSDTDILFYDLGRLRVLSKDSAGRLWSYDQAGRQMRVVDGVTRSVFALKNNRPEFEIVSDDFAALCYDPSARAFTCIGAGTVLYHLDSDGVRDAMVDPYTGMAYVPCQDSTAGEEGAALPGSGAGPERVTVWPVRVIKNRYGNVIAQNKLRTHRIASIHADTSQEYISGTYSHADGGSFAKQINPVLDGHGQVDYYQRSEETYQKSSPVYDRDGEFVYDRYQDGLDAFNEDAYLIKDQNSVYDKGTLWDESDNREEKLHMRQGDNYILENTWVSGENTPNDPFHFSMSPGRADMLKRVIPGTYIMEELNPPDGYAKTFPEPVTVRETGAAQSVSLADEKTKTVVIKADMPETYRIKGLDYDGICTDGEKGEFARTEGKGAYSYRGVAGAELALFQAKKADTADLDRYPAGWYAQKVDSEPFSWTTYDGNNHASRIRGVWTTDGSPLWLEGIPSGIYLLEEISAPPGYVRTSVPVEIGKTGQVQTVFLADDHTKLEIFKYRTADGKKEVLPNAHAAGLTLYPAVTDEAGEPVLEDGIVRYEKDRPVDAWMTDDCRRFTEITDRSLYRRRGIWSRIKSALGFGEDQTSGFQHDYEKMYEQYGAGFDELHWYYTDVPYDGKGELPALREGAAYLEESTEADRSGCVRQVWETEGRKIHITVSSRLDRTGECSHTFEYRYNYRELEGHAVSYDTADGCHRIDYLPWNGKNGTAAYVLVETETPEGYHGAPPKLVLIRETADVQMYAMENRPVPEIPEETTPEETAPETEPETPAETIPEETSLQETPPQETPETTHEAPETTETPTTAPVHPSTGGGDQPSLPETAPAETKEKGIILGRITARYDKDQRGALGFISWKNRGLSRTGDHPFAWFWMTLTAGSGIGILAGIRRRKHDKKQCKKKKKTTGGTIYGTEDPHRSDISVDGGHPDSDECGKMPGGAGGDGSGGGSDRPI